MFIFQCKNGDENSDSDFKLLYYYYKIWIHEHDILLFLLVNSHNHCIDLYNVQNKTHFLTITLLGYTGTTSTKRFAKSQS